LSTSRNPPALQIVDCLIVDMRTPTTTPAQAAGMIRRDQELLLSRVKGRTEDELRAPYDVSDGPLGHFCDSLHDLVAHVLMWDEITLAVLRDARAGRLHWSLDPRWETAEIGSALNRGGVEAGRHIPSELLLHRYHNVGNALLAEITQYDEQTWKDPSPLAHAVNWTADSNAELDGRSNGGSGGFGGGIGVLAEYVSTTPDGVLFAHAARHLGAVIA
jgi:hypothetical protein